MAEYFPLPLLSPEYIDTQEVFCLFESNHPSSEKVFSRIFVSPEDTLSTDETRLLLKRIDEKKNRFYIAGYFPYESGYEFFNITRTKKNGIRPEFWTFKEVFLFDHSNNKFFQPVPEGFLSEKEFTGQFDLELNKPVCSFSNFLVQIEKIKRHIKQGETYQVNYTFPLELKSKLHPYILYSYLKDSQKADYCAFIKNRNNYILSFSPELFFKINNNILTLKPMKGTLSRGRTLEEDEEKIGRLRNDVKEKAENLMIVDLERNDAGKICEIGTVHVESLFDIEKYETVFQMTSTVKGKLSKGFKYSDIFPALFPCGSVTGAPKKRTMEIIQELESGPRGVYCGAIGFIQPDNTAVFNVPIRTMTMNREFLQMHVGSGITWDSDPEKEYQECLLKYEFLRLPEKKFSVITSVLWTGEYKNLDLHLKRLKNSCRIFQYPWDEEKVRRFFLQTALDFKSGHSYKVRLSVNSSGMIQVNKQEVFPLSAGQKVCLSEHKTDSKNFFLFHKTTRRDVYDSELKKAMEKGFFDILFFNEKGELTEGARTNIFIFLNGKWLTPSPDCGLLEGIERSKVVCDLEAEQTKLYKEDILKARKILLTNSVRGRVGVKLAGVKN